VLPTFQIAQVQAMYAAPAQCIDLSIGVQVMINHFSINAEFHCVKRKILTNIHGQVNRQLGFAGEKQLFLQDKQIPVQFQSQPFQLFKFALQ